MKITDSKSLGREIRAKNQNKIDISLEFLYNLSEIRNANFKGVIL
jgi:hypothetical protein